MAEPASHSPAARLSRVFRKAGVLLAKGQVARALAVLQEGEALAQALGDAEKTRLFREEIRVCQHRLAEESSEV